MERALIHAHYYISKKPNMSSKKQEAMALFGNVNDTVKGAHGADEDARRGPVVLSTMLSTTRKESRRTEL